MRRENHDTTAEFARASHFECWKLKRIQSRWNVDADAAVIGESPFAFGVMCNTLRDVDVDDDSFNVAYSFFCSSGFHLTLNWAWVGQLYVIGQWDWFNSGRSFSQFGSPFRARCVYTIQFWFCHANYQLNWNAFSADSTKEDMGKTLRAKTSSVIF